MNQDLEITDINVTCDDKANYPGGIGVRFSVVLDENIKAGSHNDASFELVFADPETAKQFTPGLAYNLSFSRLDEDIKEPSDTDLSPVNPDAPLAAVATSPAPAEPVPNTEPVTPAPVSEATVTPAATLDEKVDETSASTGESSQTSPNFTDDSVKINNSASTT